MTEYLFVLGRNPALSKLELKEVYNAQFVHESDKCVILELDEKPRIRGLGGTVKIGLIGKTDYDGSESKFCWGVSDYDEDGKGEELRKEMQKEFKREKLKAIYKKDSVKPSVVIRWNVFDIIVCDGYVARTIECYNPSEIVQREKNKPEHDFMISSSVRLARIMINLSKPKKNDTLLDPFCGMGVILQEALLKGLRVIGIELDKNLVKKCKRNLHWLKRGKWEVIHGDSKKLSNSVMECDAVVSEPYMGGFLDKLPTEKQAQRTKRMLEELYAKVFSEIRNVIKHGGRIVFVIPSFRTKNGKVVKVAFKHSFTEVARVAYIVKNAKIMREVIVLQNKK